MKYLKRNLSQAVKRYIKQKEKYLNRTCRTIWDFENPDGRTYLFGSFCRNRKSVTVTIAYFVGGGIGFVPACY